MVHSIKGSSRTRTDQSVFRWMFILKNTKKIPGQIFVSLFRKEALCVEVFMQSLTSLQSVVVRDGWAGGMLILRPSARSGLSLLNTEYYWHAPEAPRRLMTHRPTVYDYKYFVHAPTLPITVMRAPPRALSQRRHQSFYVKPDRKKKTNLMAR